MALLLDYLLRIIALFALFCVGLVNSDSIGPNQCKSVTDNFDLNLRRLAGTWYLIASSPFSGNLVNTACAVATKTFVNNSIVVNYEGYNNVGGPMIPLYNGVITKEPNGNESYVISYPKHVTWPYFKYLDTNYATYDIVYGCEYLNGEYQGNVILILSRFCHLKNDILNDAIGKLEKLGIHKKFLKFGGPECCNESSSSSTL